MKGCLKVFVFGVLFFLLIGIFAGRRNPVPNGVATPPTKETDAGASVIKPAVASVASNTPTGRAIVPVFQQVDPDPWGTFEKKYDDLTITLAEDAVRKVLKNPDDATFDYLPQLQFQRPATGSDPAFWYATGKVKVMNDFGARLTRPYKVCFQCSFKDDTITPKFVEFDGAIVYRNEALYEEAAARDGKRAVGMEENSRKLQAGILDGAARMEADAKARARLRFEKEHPDEAAQKKFGGVLRNARALIKAQIYTGAEKMLRRIIAEAPGTKVAAEAQQDLESMPKTR